jgi:class 3 adenylate cyclase/tetratricopeptide (TPR) repeat protein
MNCTSCGSANREGQRFCGMCGAPLARVCATCGAPSAADQRFCGECGTRLGDAAAPASPAAASPSLSPDKPPIAERRHVSVLFADLVGFTSLSDQRDAEDVRELLSRYFDSARTVITRYGGTVEKFIGDAVMAVWGAQTIQENDAERAVRAALELVDAVAAFGEEAGMPGLAARAGVLTGEAAVTVGAVGQGMIAGDLVNTASRVQSVAEPGTVYVGDGTRQATESAIVYADAGAHPLKGIAVPVRLWRAQRVVAGNGGALRPTGLEPPFVGRDREIRLLKEYLHAAGDERKARLLSIVGVGGVGKSRLAWEFFKYVDGLSEITYWHRGRCLAYGEGVAYWALAEMVRMRAGIVENEPPSTAREKLRTTVEKFVAGEDERRWVEPRLAHLVGLEEGAASDPRDLYAAWRFFFEQMAAEKVTVLVFEDMQWADSGLLDFVEYLLEWSRGSRIFIVTLARPEISDRRPGWGAGKRGLTSLYLEPLTPDAMKQLLAGMVPGLPEDLSARIRERAAGIPLYAVETVRMLLDRGLLVEDEGTYRARGSLDALEVPESLHALIAARLDSLPAEERQLLQDAAVLGKSFTAHALRAVTGVTGADIDRVLGALVDKDMLTIQSDPRSPERGQYLFVQDLVRSVAYGTLARRDRKARHLAAAGYLESEWSEEEEVAEVVASHLAEAYSADPDAEDAAGIRERALAALVRAGDHAASLAGANSAQRYYERALELAADDDERARLHFSAGQMAWMQGQATEAANHFEAAIELTDTADRAGVARALNELASVRSGTGETAEAIELAQRALRILTEAPQDEDHEGDIARIEGRVAKFFYQRGDFDEALARAERALPIAEAAAMLDVLAYALDTKACILSGQGRLTEAEILELGALEIATAHGLRETTIISGNAGATLEEADRPEGALALYEQGETAARRMGNRRPAIHNTMGRIQALIELGRWDEATELFAGYTEIDEPAIEGDVTGYAGSLNMVWLHVWRGQGEMARALLSKVEPFLAHANLEVAADLTAARALMLGVGSDHVRALSTAEEALRASLEPSFPLTARRALIAAADAAFALGVLEKVEELILLVRRRHRPGRQPSLDAHILRWQARMSGARGDGQSAIADFETAMDAFDRLHRPFWGALTRLDYGELLLVHARAADAEEVLTEAATTFAELGAQSLLARAEGTRHARAAQPDVDSAMPA